MDYTLEKIKQHILDIIIEAFGQEVDRTKVEIEAPPSPEMGDLAVPCFYFTKVNRISPNQNAADFKEKIHPKGIIKKVENAGPYLNFYLNSRFLSKQVLKEIAKKGNQYGACKLPKEKRETIMLEYSQPNTHKEFHVGHLRNAILGSALVNLYRSQGYKVIATNYIGDIGSHVAKCLWALEKFHQGEEPETGRGKFLGKVYAEAVNKTEADPEAKKEADAVQQKLENGDKKWLALWKKTRMWSLDDFNRIYGILGAKFDKFFYESEVEKPGKKIVGELLERGIAEKSEGATIINLEKYNLKNFLLLKSDGSSLYSTKDLALAELKFKKYKLDRSYVLIDTRQDFYFQQLFKTLEVMGFKQKMDTILYEFVTLKDGAMASRKGNVVLFDDFYKEVTDRAKTETKKRHSDWDDKKIEETAQSIALAAIKLSMLKSGNESVIVFDIDEALSFDGYSGPYLQYTVSRVNSILKKETPKNIKEINFGKLNLLLEKQLVLELSKFPEALSSAAKEFQPSQIAKYLFDLARMFSSYYQAVPILNSEEAAKQARLLLIKEIRQVLVNGLELLGIPILEQM